ncbi:high frequency lysogenization protein HflD [Paraglaciecola sp.]|uniref:high frequency lysogenization protein HflD n=1 Tax=Paraglaciecola sp. TaxID=1920173 RepID=UPI0032665FDF
MSNKQNMRFYESNIALAGVCQAAALVKQIARGADYSEDSLNTSLNSISVTESDNTEQVFGAIEDVKLGYETILSQLGNQAKVKDVEITRYIANLLSIERKLSSNKSTMAALGERIANIQRQKSHLDLTDGQMLSNLDSIYSDVISPVSRKIQVAGDPKILQRPECQHRVRATLLAGVRAAVLWRQIGGKRRQILLNRTQILNSAKHTLKQISTPN